MDIRKELLKEHSKAQINKICKYISNDQECFDELMTIFFTAETRLVQRASWAVSTIAEEHPYLIKPYIKRMVKNLKKNAHDSVKRNSLRIFQFMEIPVSLQGELLDICFDYLITPKVPVAIKAFAMTVAYNLSAKEEDLMKELKIILQDQLPFSSPAFKSRAHKILK
ncbi:hypothetical protein MYP_2916 [Sporocytophaga myxococcoides]|uniref:Adenylosuccinate lyase n=1 Tax=Sporocytophaga myxococcoides TaxID=153721 RepID=A0A098LGT7_9BACT|nr:hypothetical protein [Sporocytophaga myxococcoides]GAL85687.1 hypothetical protein MYP_2916 [Sporocytophaga myxococcoides]